MYCFPPCKGCRDAGTCPKGDVPAFFLRPPPKHGEPYNPSSEGKIELVCGCWIWPFGCLVRGNAAYVSARFFCETHGRWADQVAKKRKKKKTVDYPSEPMF